jgi:hypothetical protein
MSRQVSIPRRAGRRRGLRAAVAVSAVLVLSAVTAGCTGGGGGRGGAPVDWHAPTEVDGAPLRAFTADSWWNLPLPADAPSNPDATQIQQYMRTAEEAGDGCVTLAGAEGSPWGQPVYWAEPGDPEYAVDVRARRAPPELAHLRIPAGARPAGNNDGSMTVFDVERGYTVAMTDASYDAGSKSWSASGATVTYLASNGLDARTGRSTDDRNTGTHRGNNAAVMMARFDEVSAGSIPHVLKVASGPAVSTRSVFPMVGSDGSSHDPAAPPQGLRFPIKPSVNLAALRLEPQALVIATALQRYGFYIGDSSGTTALKLEDTRTEGRGQLWKISGKALCGLPLTPEYWDVLPEGYQPPTG